MINTEIDTAVRDLVTRLVSLVEANVVRRSQVAIASVFAVATAASAPKPQYASAPKPAATGNKARRTITVTPKLLRARKLQGRYMAALRALKVADRARVKKLAGEKGAAAGLKLALSIK
jgi:hypothetical protein